MQAYIFRLLNKRYDLQEQLDKDQYHKKGPGRNRKFKYAKTSDIRKLVNKFFLGGFRKLKSNKYNTQRTDA